MRVWILERWLHVRASYWFIPSLMVVGAIVGAGVMVRIDMRFGAKWLRDAGWLYINQPDGARALLSTVAGSMITVAGVTFSMTLLAVSHASAQIGPRLITRFMRDRGNQYTLGIFIATFLYGLIVLRTVHSGEGDEGVFVPHLAILVALALAVISVMVLIYFIHHVPQTISVSNVIARVGDELVESVANLFPQRVGEPASAVDTDRTRRPASFDRNAKTLRMASDGGYLRLIDGDGLIRIACEHELIVELQQRPGDFAITSQPVMRVWPADRLNDELERDLLGVFSWGSERTRKQDVLFPVEQLLEVLGKAMSPGINGQHTALLCMNQLERAIAEALRREPPDAYRYDDGGNLRVIAMPMTHKDLLNAIFRPLRQYVRGDWIATDHLSSMLRRLQALPGLDAGAELLRTQAAQLREEIIATSMPDAEKRLLLATAD